MVDEIDSMPSRTFPKEDWDSLQRALLVIRFLIEGTTSTTPSPDYERYWDAWQIIKEVRSRCEFVRRVLGHDTFDHDAAMLSTNLQLLKIRSSRSEDTAPYIDKIHSHLQNIMRFISSLIFWAEGRSEIPLTTVSLKNFLEECCPRFENSAFIPISVDGDDSSLVLVNEGILFALLLNICRNASVHGSARKVSIKVCGGRIEISDDGNGIADETAARMFELGFTTGHGKGIGLGDARKRMQAMGGDISCETHGGLENRNGGRGAKFILSFRKATPARK